MHVVHFLNAAEPYDPVTDAPRIERRAEFADWNEARGAAFAHAEAAANPLAVAVVADPDLFASLSAYIAAVNIGADLADAIPAHGLWVGRLTDDLAHWAEIGVETPADFAAYLDGCFEREMQKERMRA